MCLWRYLSTLSHSLSLSVTSSVCNVTTLSCSNQLSLLLIAASLLSLSRSFSLAPFTSPLTYSVTVISFFWPAVSHSVCYVIAQMLSYVISPLYAYLLPVIADCVCYVTAHYLNFLQPLYFRLFALSLPPLQFSSVSDVTALSLALFLLLILSSLCCACFCLLRQCFSLFLSSIRDLSLCLLRHCSLALWHLLPLLPFGTSLLSLTGSRFRLFCFFTSLLSTLAPLSPLLFALLGTRCLSLCYSIDLSFDNLSLRVSKSSVL